MVLVLVLVLLCLGLWFSGTSPRSRVRSRRSRTMYAGWQAGVAYFPLQSVVIFCLSAQSLPRTCHGGTFCTVP